MRFRIACIFAILLFDLAGHRVLARQVIDGGFNRQSAGRPQRPVNPVLRVLDADGDGKLSEFELRNAAASLRRLDVNRDGRLTENEYRRSRETAVSQPDSSQAESSAQLVDQWVSRIFSMDDDQNGYLNSKELHANLRSLMSGDANYDGQLSRNELSSVLTREFRQRGLIRSDALSNDARPARDVARRPLRPEAEGE